MVLGQILGAVASDEVTGYFEKKREERKKRPDTQTEVDFESESLAPGESEVITFNSAEKNGPLRGFYPFSSTTLINSTGESLAVLPNQKSDLRIPVPDGAQNGDSFPDTGIYGLEVVNMGQSAVDVKNDLTAIVSGDPEGVNRLSK